MYFTITKNVKHSTLSLTTPMVHDAVSMVGLKTLLTATVSCPNYFVNFRNRVRTWKHRAV